MRRLKRRQWRKPICWLSDAERWTFVSLHADGLAGSGHPAGHTERRRRRGGADTRRRSGSTFVQSSRIPSAARHLAARRRAGDHHPQRIPSKDERYEFNFHWNFKWINMTDVQFRAQFRFTKGRCWHFTKSPDPKWEPTCAVSPISLYYILSDC